MGLLVDNPHYLSDFGSIVCILGLIQLLVNLTNHRKKKDMNLSLYLSLNSSHKANDKGLDFTTSLFFTQPYT